MNPSTAQAGVIVDELVRCGVRHAVLCPGSRNAPLAFALHAADRQGRLELHVRIDERSAGYLALGLALGGGAPVPVMCTSGTAVANLHPALAEAAHSQVGVVAVTADRPPELLGTGANQTTWQQGMFEPHVRTVALPVAERRPGQNAAWRSLICRTLAAAEGPVHLNVPFREPLVPDETGDDWPEPLAGRGGDLPWTAVDPVVRSGGPSVDLPGRTVVVLGAGPASAVAIAARAAARRGWPVLAEPPAVAPALAAGAQVIEHAALILSAGLPQRLGPEAIVVGGRPTLTRGVQALLGSGPPVHVVDDPRRYADPQFAATAVTAGLEAPGASAAGWLGLWRDAGRRAARVVETHLKDTDPPGGLHVARDLFAAVPESATVLLGSSNPIRDVDLVAAPRAGLRVVANRGLAGIDGTVSTASGLALAGGAPAYALVGDLTFLHDVGGLLVGPSERRPDLTIVVVNDRGGGIFGLLEQGDPRFADAGFERVFGTRHDADLASLCRGYGVEHCAPADRAEFLAAVAPRPGLRVVEVRTSRTTLRQERRRLREAVAGVLQG